ncbi:unnamed protein product, partial [Symbiodinium sp. CCMP2456]
VRDVTEVHEVAHASAMDSRGFSGGRNAAASLVSLEELEALDASGAVQMSPQDGGTTWLEAMLQTVRGFLAVGQLSGAGQETGVRELGDTSPIAVLPCGLAVSGTSSSAKIIGTMGISPLCCLSQNLHHRTPVRAP